MTVLKWALRVLIALIGIAAIVWTLGMFLPRDHMVSRIGHYQVPPEKVWTALTDIDAMPAWRIGLKSVTRLPDKNALPVHVEDTSAGKLTFETTVMDPPHRLVRGIVSDKLPFGGTWTFDLAPAPDGSTLRITENGYVTNPIFRFVARYIVGYTSEIDKYLTGLAQHFGEKPQIGD
ncbi:MAG TPA: SRPBCC family protein [Candidatus Sulfotelmatobacter sp.]|nr:SRPBCC family protein [Candidatus Sulfotelmatobacter sp.]